MKTRRDNCLNGDMPLLKWRKAAIKTDGFQLTDKIHVSSPHLFLLT